MLGTELYYKKILSLNTFIYFIILYQKKNFNLQVNFTINQVYNKLGLQ